ncbi:MAG: histidine phosphatase family protein [Nocardioides sp.]|nr:histidine phosphatase family protein [Nocardioides sp.]
MPQLLLVRHGQASWGAADYDQLSDLGAEQSRAVGAALVRRGVEPDLLLRGGLRRHRQTAEHAVVGAGWDQQVHEDRDWDEYGHDEVFARHPTGLGEGEGFVDEDAFRLWFDGALHRWTGGEHDPEYDEPFAHFTRRVEQGLTRTVERLHDEGRRTAVVVTSGGAIAWVVTHLLGGDPAMWVRLNLVTANASVTKVVAGRRGTTLMTYNDHSHFEGDASSLLTYR